ncbi:leucyl aminopeptidase [Skermanella aerolata]|uniref:Leucyl aminopeptidase n=1 Tax=Skermanella aerolata TaxID=393310 RepID=A0A512DY20_9PROT|nr:leucyl aminopeptidase family protein [Skermanella aerolata]KJB93914.1 cytosol aminopeptidase [Skermanella aerolata KACC 11604]GEO41374.1 leucyl aminopeptidase [Skermanella aerolata]
MLTHLRPIAGADSVPLTPVTKDGLESWLSGQPATVRAWVSGIGFKGEPGKTALLPGADGGFARVLAGIDAADFWAYGGLPASLPPGDYHIDADLDRETATRAALGWALGTYAFTRYKSGNGKTFATLAWPERADRAEVERIATATYLVRDLINTPASDMGPEELAQAAETLGDEFNAKVKVIVGDDLLKKNYPAIHAVGRASTRAPRLIDLTWGDKDAPGVTLVGKGVCFDTGGLDLKPSSGMLLMKKDMGGAAHVLGVARMIMMAELPVRLRVLIPAVENSVSGDAFRPLDVLATRKGLTVEVGNTDAEGRLVLCDALAKAVNDKPEVIIDFATLTGAARVALGTELPALFSNDDALADGLLKAAESQSDPMWRLPLHQPYAKLLDSKVADLNNVGSGPFAGAILAALFLERFVEKTTPWAHLDVMAWNPSSKPGRPEGGEALGMRAVYSYLESRYAKSA